MNTLALTLAQGAGPLQKFVFGDEAASAIARDSDRIFWGIFWFCVFWFILLMGLMFYWCVKYRRRPGVPAQRTAHHNTKLELAWTILPSVFLGAMFYYGFRGYITNLIAPSSAEVINVVGQKWDWLVTHPNGSSPNERVQVGGKMDAPVIYIPVGRPVQFRITSRDVLHSFWIPDFRYKFDAMPNRYSSFWIEAEETGDHWIFCAEYCGDFHSEMAAVLRVVSEAEYQAQLADQADPGDDPVVRGQVWVQNNGCAACHSVNGAPGIGPTWQNAWGYEVALASGATIPADDPDAWDNYVRESILDPNAKIHAGYASPSQMVSYAGSLDEDQISDIIAYFRSLSDKGPAPEADPAEGEESAEGEQPAEGSTEE